MTYNKALALNEEHSNVAYHFTTDYNLIGILESGLLKASDEPIKRSLKGKQSTPLKKELKKNLAGKYISTARTRGGFFERVESECFGGSKVNILLKKNNISTIRGLKDAKPVNYYGDGDYNGDEDDDIEGEVFSKSKTKENENFMRSQWYKENEDRYHFDKKTKKFKDKVTGGYSYGIPVSSKYMTINLPDIDSISFKNKSILKYLVKGYHKKDPKLFVDDDNLKKYLNSSQENS